MDYTHPIFKVLPQPTLVEPPSSNIISNAKTATDHFIAQSFWVSPLIETSKSLLTFLPGRFSTTNLSGETLYAILSLLSQYTNRLAGKPTINPYSLHYYQNVDDSPHLPPFSFRTTNNILSFLSIFESLLEQTAPHAYMRWHSNYFNTLLSRLLLRKEQAITKIFMGRDSMIPGLDARPIIPPHSYNTQLAPTNNPALLFQQVNGTQPQLESLQQQQQQQQQQHQQEQHKPSLFELSQNEILSSHPSVIEYLSHDTQYQALLTAQTQFDHQIYAFKMLTCFGIEFIKCLARLFALYTNGGKTLTPQTALDCALQQIQYTSRSERTRYDTDQTNLSQYHKAFWTWLAHRRSNASSTTTTTTTTTTATIQSESTIRQGQSTHLPKPKLLLTKPAVTSTTSVWTSPLTSYSYNPSSLIQNDSQFPLAAISKLSMTRPKTALTEMLTTRDAYCVQAIKHTYIHHHRGAMAHGMYGLDLIRLYLLHYHFFAPSSLVQQQTKQLSSSSSSSSLQSSSVDAMPQLATTNHLLPSSVEDNDDANLPALTVNHYSMVSSPTSSSSLLNSRVLNFRKALSNTKLIDATQTDCSIMRDIAPPSRILDFVLSLYGLPSINSHLQQQQSQQEQETQSEPGQTSLQIATSTIDHAHQQQQQQQQQQSLLPSFYNDHSSSTRSICGEVLYWVRPVVYTFSLGCCLWLGADNFNEIPGWNNSISVLPPSSSSLALVSPTSALPLSSPLPTSSSFSISSFFRLPARFFRWVFSSRPRVQQPLSFPSSSSSSSSSSSVGIIAFMRRFASAFCRNPLAVLCTRSFPLLPLFISIAMDFLALFFSPAGWDPHRALSELHQRQHDEMQLLKAQCWKTDLAAADLMNNNTSSSSSSSSSVMSSPLSTIALLTLKKHHKKQHELLLSQIATWQNRKQQYLLYLLRPPVINLFLLPLSSLQQRFLHVPLIGSLLNLVTTLLKVVNYHYFYTSGS